MAVALVFAPYKAVPYYRLQFPIDYSSEFHRLFVANLDMCFCRYLRSRRKAPRRPNRRPSMPPAAKPGHRRQPSASSTAGSAQCQETPTAHLLFPARRADHRTSLQHRQAGSVAGLPAEWNCSAHSKPHHLQGKPSQPIEDCYSVGIRPDNSHKPDGRLSIAGLHIPDSDPIGSRLCPRSGGQRPATPLSLSATGAHLSSSQVPIPKQQLDQTAEVPTDCCRSCPTAPD